MLSILAQTAATTGMRVAEVVPGLLVLLLMARSQAEKPQVVTVPAAKEEISTGRDESIRLKVGPPEATLAVWVLEPPAGTRIRGTVLFLHGFLASHYQVLNAGNALRKAGYRAVMVDLRGFGQSTGDHITFGVQDSGDLTQLTDELQRQGLCGATLGVYGTSYGAGSAILYAAADPRVTTVVAVAPFATIRDEVPAFSRSVTLGLGSLFSDADLNVLANKAAEVANLDLDNAKPIDAIVKSHARFLLIHGDDDTIIPHHSSELLHAANPERSELLTVANRGHLQLCFDIPGELQGATRAWFDRYLASQR